LDKNVISMKLKLIDLLSKKKIKKMILMLRMILKLNST